MTPQELKNSILQLAIQGKLVPQHAEEGTAEELYNQIQAEKQKLIKTILCLSNFGVKFLNVRLFLFITLLIMC